MKKSSKKNKKILLIGIILLVVLIGIALVILLTNKKEEKPKEENNIDTPKGEVKIIDENSKSRPIAIMINNAKDARPNQKGLQKAYIVYEIINYVDGSTRFMALFKDQDLEEVGPIRSTRHYHLDYVLENDAIFVHWGYSPKAQSDLKTLGINNINGITYGSDNNKDKIGDKAFFWTATIPGVNISHRRFTSTELIDKGIERLNYRTETEQENLFNYSASLINIKDMENTTKASSVDIYYAKNNYVTYEYDADSHTYLRSVNGVSHKDSATGEQLKVTNIITYKVKNTTIPGDDDDRQDLHNIGTGEGYFITDGYAAKIKWSKECRKCQTKYTYLNGEEITLNDGNTFIQIEPEGQELKIS